MKYTLVLAIGAVHRSHRPRRFDAIHTERALRSGNQSYGSGDTAEGDNPSARGVHR